MKILKKYRTYKSKIAHKKLVNEIESILGGRKQENVTQNINPEELFNSLQKQYSPRNNYKYDPYNTWLRGIQRAKKLLSLEEIQEAPIDILEFACGDGMTGQILSDYGHAVEQHDLEDWRDERAKDLPFHQADLKYPFSIKDKSYDLIFSYNSFEHIPDPKLTFDELIRLCKPNGLVYLEFGPLYSSAWGLHAYKTIYMPYPQYLFKEDFILKKLHELGINDLGQELDALQPLNKWKLRDFNTLWNDNKCKIVDIKYFRDFKHIDIVKKYPAAFQNKELSLEDVTTQAIAILLRKR